MAEGIHFVSRDENHVGFVLWQISTAVQDSGWFSDESSLDNDAINTIDATKRDRHVPLIGDHVRNREAQVGLEATDARSAAGQVRTLFEQAKALAAGKDPNDADTITQLEQLHTQVQALVGRASADADDAFGSLDDSARI